MNLSLADKFAVVADFLPEDDDGEYSSSTIELARKAVTLAGRLMSGEDKKLVEKELDKIIALMEVEMFGIP